MTLTRLAGDGTASPAIALAPDDAHLLVAASRRRGGCRVLKLAGGSQRARFDAHRNTVTVAAFSTDGQIIATSAEDDHSIVLWDTSSGERISQIRGGGQTVWSVAFSPDGRYLAFGNSWASAQPQRSWLAQSQLDRAFDLTTMRPAERSVSQLQTAAAAAGRERPQQAFWVRATMHQQGWTVDCRDGKTLTISNAGRVAANIALDHPTDSIRCFGFLPAVPGRGGGEPRIIVGSDFELAVYHAAGGRKLQRFVGHLGSVWSVAASPDGRWLASGSSDQTFRLWNLENVQPVVTDAFAALSFFVTRDNQWVAWTPEGYYKASLEGHHLIGWQINREPDRTARFVNAWQVRRLFHRPEWIEQIPQAGSLRRAIERHNEDTHNRPEEVQDIRRQLIGILPPEVTLLAPRPKRIVDADHVLLRARLDTPAEPRPDAQLLVRVAVNGRPVPGWEEHPIRLPTPPREDESGPDPGARDIVRDAGAEADVIEVDVPLLPDENEISVVVRTESAGGQPNIVHVTSRPERPQRIRPELHLLSIGVSEYRDRQVRDLEFADDDARELVASFQAQEGRLFARVRATTLVDERATKREILKAVEQLGRDVTQIDLAIVAVSGHGDRDAADRYFFIPHDFEYGFFATAVRWSDLQDPLSRLPCPVILLMDTCHSSGVTGRDYALRDLASLQDSLETAVAELAGLDSGLLVLSSSMAAEQAIERSRWRHGAFVLSVIEAIQGRHLYSRQTETPLPAGNESGIVELSELRDYVVRRVKELTGGSQHAISQPKDLPRLPIAVVPTARAN